MPTPLIAAYGASKAGVHSIGRTLRFELAHTGAKAGTAYFAEIDTDMTRIAHKVPHHSSARWQNIPETLHRVQPVEVASNGCRAWDREAREPDHRAALGQLDGHLERARPADRMDLPPATGASSATGSRRTPRRSTRRRRRKSPNEPTAQMAPPAPMENHPAPDHEVAIIGAGLGGLGMAAALKRKNIQDFAIFERADDVGGTWRDNTYPGIAVDIPVFAYQFSYDLKPDWARFFPRGHEVKAYIDEYTDKYGIRPHIRFNSEVRSRTWDEANHLWRLDVDGEEVTARFVISAIGPFVDPKPAEIPGVDDFEGKSDPLGPLGPRLRPRRQAGRDHRHRRERSADRALDPPGTSAGSTSTSAPRSGSPKLDPKIPEWMQADVPSAAAARAERRADAASLWRAPWSSS